MRVKSVIIALIVLALGTAFVVANSGTVTSGNAVGYVKRTFTKGEWNLFSVNFDMTTGGNNITNVMPLANYVSGTYVYRWDVVGQQYQSSQLQTFPPPDKWSTEFDMNRGECFFIKIPGIGVQTSFFLGDVPDDASFDVDLVDGYAFVSFPYPTEETLTNSMLNDIAESGDFVYYWSNQQWNSIQYTTFPPPGGWAKDHVFTPGDGFIYVANSDTNWLPPKPYDWPN